MKPHRLERSLRATFIGLGVNAVLAGVKFTAGVVGHSNALIADAVESFADILSSLIVWRAVVVASRPADKDHPYGHGKAEPVASAVVATLLLLAAVGITIKSLQEILNPHQSPEPFTLAVLLGVVVVKEMLFRFVHKEGHEVESGALKSDAWHHRSDAITSLAAAIGISVALIMGKGYEGADDAAAVLAAGIIGWNGWRLLRPALDELMDTVPDDEVTSRIRTIAEETPEVTRVEKCVVRKMGYQLLVDMHIEVDPEMSVREAHRVSHHVKDRVRGQVQSVRDVLIHIEPDRPGNSSSQG